MFDLLPRQERSKAPRQWENLQGLLTDFANYIALGAGPRQVLHNLSVAERFLQTIGLDKLSEIDQHTIVDFLSCLAIGPKTIRNYVAALSRFCSWLEVCGFLTSNPTRGLRLPRLQPRIPHYLTDQEITQALALARKHDCYIEVCLALNTGLRREELRMLRWDQVDLSRRVLKIPAGKSKRPGIVPLNAEALAVLECQRAVSGRLDYVFPGWRSRRWRSQKSGLLRNGPRRKEGWREALLPLCRMIPAFQSLPPRTVGRGWHMFRHTFASRLAQRGVSLYKISRWLRHSSIQTTQIYAHLAEGWDKDIENPIAERIHEDGAP